MVGMIAAPAITSSVPIAHFSGRCALSPGSVNESFVSPEGKGEEIIGIAKLYRKGSNELVGWVYRTASDRLFVQALTSMPRADKLAVGLRDLPDGPAKFVGNPPVPAPTSRIVGLGAHTFKDVRVGPCTMKTLEP